MTVICKKHLELDLKKKSALLDLNVKVINSILMFSVFSFCFPLRKVPSSSTITLIFKPHVELHERFIMKSIMIVILFLVFASLIDKDNSPFFLQDTWFIIF